MAEFTVNSQRFSPYAAFKFRVKWDNTYVAGVSKVSALTRTTEVIKHREGGDPSSPHLSPGQTSYGAVTLERGITFDPAFQQWALLVWNYNNAQASADQRTQEVSLANFRKEVTIELHNEAGQIVLAYHLMRAWVSECQVLPELDAGANAVAIEHIKLEHEGFVRDTAITEAKELSFTT
jgi:phage tail-like protein